jgi:mono/diheme cytochrome c family protein
MRRLALLGAVLVALGGVAACGGEEEASPTPETVEGTMPESGEPALEGDAEKGASIFAAQGCGGCHVLQAAGSTGTAGPNLDQSSVEFDAAVSQIANGGGGMPPFRDELSDQEIADVAAYVTERRSG